MKQAAIFVTLVASLILASCAKEPALEQSGSLTQEEGTRIIAVSFAPQTKTALGEDGRTPVFQEGDRIMISNGVATKTIAVHIDENGNAYFSTSLSGELTAVYPAAAAEVKGNVIKGIRVPAEQSGRFADANIAMAEHIADNAKFVNRTALFIITPPPGATTLKVTSLPAVVSGERTGDVVPVNTEGAGEEANRVTVEGLDEDGKFYVSLFPGVCLSDLAFETINARREFSIGEIEAAETENIASEGRLYLISGTKWQTLSQTIKDANNALKSGETSVEINNPTDPETPVTFPAASDGKNISVTLSGVSASEITFKLEEGAKGPANLDIETDAQSLVINLPDSHVAVNGGDYQTVTAITSASTLAVGKNVTIGTLAIQGGSADIAGLISKVTNTGSGNVCFSISSRETLVRLSELVNGGNVPSCTAVLTEDIDLSGLKWKSINTNSRLKSFDGQGHTIDNMDVDTDNAEDWAGFISKAYNDFTIKNVTFTNAKLEWPASAVTDARGGIVVGSKYEGDIINCHVKNSHISAFQKIGGIVGCIFETTSDVTVKDCTVDGLDMEYSIEDPDGSYTWQAGGIAGYVTTCGNRRFEKCSVKDITVKSPYDGTDNRAYFSHAFVGNLITFGANCGGKTVIFKDNSVDAQLDNVTPGIYSSDFFAWADNAERVNVDLPAIIIDGKTWYPDYPFQNKTKGINYLTIAQASAAASEGDVIHITKGGEYTVETLSLPAGCILEATAEGVALVHTPTSTSWVANCGDNTTVKNLTWNVGTANHQYFHGVNLVNCKVNGLLCTHSNNSYTDCEFYNENSYNLWEYGSGSTFIRCKFTCPGGAHSVGGGAVNAYNEGQQGMKVVSFESCQFFALTASDYYSAVYIKPETDFDIRFTDCSADENFCIGEISGSRLWNVKNNTNTNTKVTVDGAVVYANGALSNQ